MLRDTFLSSKARQFESNENVEVDHEYEVLHRYSQVYEEVQVPQALPPNWQKEQQPSSTADCVFTQCPAYISVTRGNQQTDSVTQTSTTSYWQRSGHVWGRR